MLITRLRRSPTVRYYFVNWRQGLRVNSNAEKFCKKSSPFAEDNLLISSISFIFSLFIV
jgi:hypothetical protein